CLFLRREGRADEGQKVVLSEPLQGRHRLPLSDANLSLRQRSTVSGFHLARNSRISLPRASADQLATPHEFVRISSTAFVDRHRFTPSLFQPGCGCRPAAVRLTSCPASASTPPVSCAPSR